MLYLVKYIFLHIKPFIFNLPSFSSALHHFFNVSACKFYICKPKKFYLYFFISFIVDFFILILKYICCKILTCYILYVINVVRCAFFFSKQVFLFSIFTAIYYISIILCQYFLSSFLKS